MSVASYGNESQEFSYLDDSNMNFSEHAPESNIDPEGSFSSLQDTIFTAPPLPENKYLVITKDPITLARARSILHPNVYTSFVYTHSFRRAMILRNLWHRVCPCHSGHAWENYPKFGWVIMKPLI